MGTWGVTFFLHQGCWVYGTSCWIDRYIDRLGLEGFGPNAGRWDECSWLVRASWAEGPISTQYDSLTLFGTVQLTLWIEHVWNVQHMMLRTGRVLAVAKSMLILCWAIQWVLEPELDRCSHTVNSFVMTISLWNHYSAALKARINQVIITWI